MSTSREAKCAAWGHEWLPWGTYHQVQRPFVPTIFPLEVLQAKNTEVLAYRYRQCENCGVKQRQAWGTDKTENAPSIERLDPRAPYVDRMIK